MNWIPIISLLLSNLLPIFGVLFFRWNASEMLFIYWTETIVIGFYNILKMVAAKKPAKETTEINGVVQKAMSKTQTILFFILHFGIFSACMGAVLFQSAIKNLVFDLALYFSLISMFVSHGVSYVLNYLGKKEYESKSTDDLFWAPYSRIILIIMTVWLSTGIAFFFDQSVVTLITMVLLKTAADLFSHMFEHRQNGVYVMKPWGNNLLKPIMPAIDEITQKSLIESMKNGNFEKFNKDLDPEVAKKIKDYYLSGQSVKTDSDELGLEVKSKT
jgi:hypothetical protein